MKDAGNYEAAARLKQAVAELKDNLELSSAASGIDSLVQYFYDHTVSFLDYFTEKDSLIILDEPARVAEKGEAVTAEYRESMMGRLEKGYVLPGQTEAIYECRKILARMGSLRTVLLSTLSYNSAHIAVKSKYSMMASSMHTYRGDFQLLVKELTDGKTAVID